MERSGAKYLFNNIKCVFCDRIFNSPNRNKNQRFCSKSCAKKNKPTGNVFKLGNTAWNKGLLGYGLGRKCSDETKEKLKTINYREKSPFWKGDKASYSSKHKWFLNHFGKAKECEFCGKRGNWIDWANKSREYKRDLDDWIQLCRSCHYKYDRYGQKAIKIG